MAPTRVAALPIGHDGLMNDQAPTISTHVLDTENGRPAGGVEVALMRVEESEERLVGRGVTDDDGRIGRLLEGELESGFYRIEFRIDGRFFMSMAIWFRIEDTSRSYHVPLLLAPYQLGTYLGS
jgi:5-hydroxyisourate hydrolase